MGKRIHFEKKPKEVKMLRSSGNYNYEKHKEKYRAKRRKQHFWLRVFVVLGLIIGAIVFVNSSFFDVDTIQVEGNKYFEAEQIINISNAETGGNIFWGSNKGEIKSRLLANPYIRSVKISSKLPRTLIITVEERIQQAYFKIGKKYVLIDSEGCVLKKTKTKPKLIEITNIKVTSAEEGEIIQLEEERNFEKILNIMDKMSENNLYFSKLKIKQGTVYANVYKNLVCIGDYKVFIKTMENGKLSKIIYKLNKEHIKRGSINITDEDYISYKPI